MDTSRSIRRRRFLAHGAGIGAGIAAVPAMGLSVLGANERVRAGVMGLGRGLDLIRTNARGGGTDIVSVCDVDQRRVDRALQVITKGELGRAPAATQDYRRLLDDKSLDALFVATCNHWHAPATISAVKAGKHVYVEKPGSHNAHEAALVVAAARKHDRVVQQGTQRRTWPSIVEAIEKLRSGAIGALRFARCWYANTRPSIRKGSVATVPKEIDFEMWQGPAPDRPYKDNLIHYNWHWQWHWGGGELANNGVHALDIARWGLGVDVPRRVTYLGGRYHYNDDQETPDTGVAQFDFGDKGVTWEGSSCHRRAGDRVPFVAFYGDGGQLVVHDPGYEVLDNKGNVVEKGAPRRDDALHIRDFVSALRGEKKRPAADIEIGQTSALLCHLGNIAYRLGRSIDVDPETRQIVGTPESRALWGREYRAGMQPTLD